MNLEINKIEEELSFPKECSLLYSEGNAQVAEFNPQGTMLAIGCKYATLMIMDFATKENVRLFSFYDPISREANDKVSTFAFCSNTQYMVYEDETLMLGVTQNGQGAEKMKKAEKR